MGSSLHHVDAVVVDVVATEGTEEDIGAVSAAVTEDAETAEGSAVREVVSVVGGEAGEEKVAADGDVVREFAFGFLL